MHVSSGEKEILLVEKNSDSLAAKIFLILFGGLKNY